VAAPAATGPVAGDDVDQVRGVRGRHLDGAATRPHRHLEVLGQPEQVDEPVHHARLDLRHRRARRPQHPLRAQAGGDQLGEHGRARRVRREVGEPARGLPLRDARHHDVVQVAKQVANGSGSSGARSGSRAAISPGATGAATGSSSTRAMWSASQSTSACPWARNASGSMWKESVTLAT
jgi:hypothetical protein